MLFRTVQTSNKSYSAIRSYGLIFTMRYKFLVLLGKLVRKATQMKSNQLYYLAELSIFLNKLVLNLTCVALCEVSKKIPLKIIRWQLNLSCFK